MTCNQLYNSLWTSKQWKTPHERPFLQDMSSVEDFNSALMHHFIYEQTFSSSMQFRSVCDQFVEKFVKLLKNTCILKSGERSTSGVPAYEKESKCSITYRGQGTTTGTLDLIRGSI